MDARVRGGDCCFDKWICVVSVTDDDTIAWPVVGSATCTIVVFAGGGEVCEKLSFFGDGFSSSGVVLADCGVVSGMLSGMLSACAGFMTTG